MSNENDDVTRTRTLSWEQCTLVSRWEGYIALSHTADIFMYKCVYVAPVPVYYYYFASIILASFYTQPGALYIYIV